MRKARTEAGKSTKRADIHSGDLGERENKVKTVWSSTRQNVQIISQKNTLQEKCSRDHGSDGNDQENLETVALR